MLFEKPWFSDFFSKIIRNILKIFLISCSKISKFIILESLAEIIGNGFFNPHLHERVSEHRDQKYFGEVSFRPVEYRNRPPIVPLIFNFKNFGEF
jgi:hypothetical protein